MALGMNPQLPIHSSNTLGRDKNERIKNREMYDERKSEEKGFFRKKQSLRAE